MKILRRILVYVLIIILIAVSIGFLLPRKVHVERRLLINSSQKNIFEQINTLKNWLKWSPWMQTDPMMQSGFSGPESGVGANYTWHSNNKDVANGSISVICSVPYDSLQVIMDFSEKGKSGGKFLLVNEGPKTNVIWSVDSDLGMNPVSRWFGLFSDHMIGPDLERGLLNLGKLTAEIKTINGYNIIDCEVPAKVLLSVRDTSAPGTITPKLAFMFKKISLFLKVRSLSPTGVPLTVFHNYSNSVFDLEACIPVASVIPVPEGLHCYEKNAEKAIMVKYIGSYKFISRAYNALQIYIKDKRLEVTGPPWEEYVTDLSQQADTTTWQTNIYYPVK